MKCRTSVFSSSCSVYGNAAELPVSETTPIAEPESPYARTKVMGENICRDFARAHQEFNVALLRYFNPAGAHESCKVGELQEQPENVVPVITQTGIGKRSSMTVYGTDYATRDGSCVRDYIHVMDIAAAHTKALAYLMEDRNAENCEVFNLGSGDGVTVLELIAAFEKTSGQKLNYTTGERRPGDVVAIYANNDKARNALNWQPTRNLDVMMDTAWRWEQHLKSEKSSHQETLA